MKRKQDILDMLPSTSEESVLRRIGHLVPKLHYPIPSFREVQTDSFDHFQTKLSSVEGLQNIFGRQIYYHISTHPLLSHIQQKLEIYQNGFSLAEIAREIENQLPKDHKNEPLEGSQIATLIEVLGKKCIPDWVCPKDQPPAVAFQLADVIKNKQKFEEFVAKNTFDNFAFEPLAKYLEKARSQRHPILDVENDCGANITRSILLKALSRCLGPFFIRCLLYAFRKFVVVSVDGWNCRYSIDVESIRYYANGQLNSPHDGSRPNATGFSPPTTVSHQTTTLDVEGLISFRRPQPASNFASPRPGAIPTRSWSSEGGSDASSLPGSTPEDLPSPQPGAVFNRNAFSLDGTAPAVAPLSPGLCRFPLRSHIPNPTFGLLPSGIKRRAVTANGEPVYKRNVNEAGRQQRLINKLQEQQKKRIEEVSTLHNALQKRAVQVKEMQIQEEKAAAEMKETSEKMRAMEAEMEQNNAAHRSQMQLLEEQAQQAAEKIKKLEEALAAAAGNQVDPEVIQGYETNSNCLKKQLAVRISDIATLQREREELRNENKLLGERYRDGPLREVANLKEIARLQGEMKIVNQRLAESEAKNQEKIEENDSLEKQFHTAQKQMLQEMKRANEEMKQCQAEREKKKEMEDRLRERHRVAEAKETELKARMENLEKELAAKAEQGDSPLALQRITAELQKITKERDELKKEVNEKREELKKTEEIFEGMENRLETARKDQEELEKKMTSETKIREETEKKHKKEIEAATVKIKKLEKQIENEGQERTKAVEAARVEQDGRKTAELVENIQQYQTAVEDEMETQKKKFMEKMGLLESEVRQQVLNAIKTNLYKVLPPPE